MSTRFARYWLALALTVWPVWSAIAGEGAAEGTEQGAHHVNWIFAGSLMINFLLFVGLIFFLVRKPAIRYFASRSEEVAKRLAAADDAKRAAELKLKEYADKIDELLNTREDVLARAEKEAAAERERILVAAREQAERLARDAALQLEQQLASAKEALSKEAVAAIAREAEALLTKAVTPDDLLRLADSYIDKLKEVKRA